MREYVPSGVIPAVLLPFHEDLSIDESSYRAHLRDVASVEGLSALTVNAHASRPIPRSGPLRRTVAMPTQAALPAIQRTVALLIGIGNYPAR